MEERSGVGVGESLEGIEGKGWKYLVGGRDWGKVKGFSRG